MAAHETSPLEAHHCGHPLGQELAHAEDALPEEQAKVSPDVGNEGVPVVDEVLKQRKGPDFDNWILSNLIDKCNNWIL